MYSVLLITNPGNGSHPLAAQISEAGMACQVDSDLSQYQVATAGPLPQAVLLDLGSLDATQSRPLIGQCRELKLPVLAVVPKERVLDYDPSLNPDEFILCPFAQEELVARVKQAIYRVNGPSGSQILKIGQLVIDLEKYEVRMTGRRVSLTYKEFQLLVLLASSPGRVYSRDMLLSQIWGYEYLGGTRTVDVHVRRLRSKIEDPDNSFIETIWNVGYRFKTEYSEAS